MGRDTSAVARKYAAALIAAALAVLIRWLLDPWLGDYLPLATLFGAVALAVWYGGHRPAVLAAVLGYLACDWLFVPPRGALGLDDPRSLVGLALYAMSCSIIILFGEAMHAARRRAGQEARRREQADRVLQDFIRCVPFGIALFDEQMRYVRVNEPLARMNGRPARDDHVGKEVAEIVPSLVATAETIFKQVMQTGKPVLGKEFEGETAQAPGVRRWWEESWFPLLDEKGVPAGAGVVVQEITERKEAEQRLRATLTLARQVSDVAPCVLYIYDLDERRNVWGNRGMFDGLGYSREQLDALSGDLLAALMHPDDFGRYPEHAARLLDLPDGETAEYEYRMRAADGSWRWLVSRDMVFRRADDGRVTQIVGAALDITERKRAEAALREQERRFRGTFDNAAVGISHVGLDGRWLRVNDRICAITGFTREELLRMTFVDVTHPDDLEPDWAQARRLIAGEIDTYTLEKRYVRKDGSLVPIELTVSLARGEGGEPAYFISVIQDISERKRAEQLLRDLVECCPFGIYIVDSQFRIALVNVGSQQGAFRNVRPLIGREFAEAMNIIWPAPVAADAIGRFRHTLETGEVFRSTDFVNPRQDIGQTEAYEWELHRVTLPDGRHGVVCYYFDATKLRQAEQALKEADRRKDDFLAMLGHELRNPLGPIRNAVRILCQTGSQEPVARRVCDMIDRQVTHMARLVDDLLDVSRITRGKIRLRLEPCDLAAIVRRTAEDYWPSAEGSGLSLDVDVPDRPLLVNGDPTRLAQVVGNLLHNAVKFTDRGGRVTVRVSAEADAAVVAVRDTGMGMEPGVLARLFEPFTQADQSLDRSRGGLGLGLALVKGLVELHGGSVAAHSDGPGRGSTLTVRLPLTKTAPAPAPRPPAAPPRGVLRVLVIEDNPDAAESLRELLSLAGHQVETASNGPTGLRLARELRPHVVLCDIGLPKGMDGYAVARALRAEPGLAPLRLVALTGYGQEEDLRLAREAGFDQHLVKPAEYAALSAALAVPSSE